MKMLARRLAPVPVHVASRRTRKQVLGQARVGPRRDQMEERHRRAAERLDHGVDEAGTGQHVLPRLLAPVRLVTRLDASRDVGYGHDESAAPTEHAGELFEHDPGPERVIQHVRGLHEVEEIFMEGQTPHVRLDRDAGTAMDVDGLPSLPASGDRPALPSRTDVEAAHLSTRLRVHLLHLRHPVRHERLSERPVWRHSVSTIPFGIDLQREG